MTFQVTWNNFIMQKKYNVFSENKLLYDAIESYYPLSPNFEKWINDNHQSIEVKLNDPRLFIIHYPHSPQDITNWLLSRNKHLRNENVFPVSQKISDHMAHITTDWEKFETNLEKKLEGVDESGQSDRTLWNQEQEDYWLNPFGKPCDPLTEEPEITHTSDFDQNGWFLPLDNQNNSTDYQDDFDPLDYDAELWQSADEVDDHHNDAYFKDVAITETPEFDENGKISWQLEDYESPE